MRSLTGNATQAQLKQISPPHLPSLRSRLLPPLLIGILMRSLAGNPTQAQLKKIIASENLTAPFDFPRFLEVMKKHLDPEPFDHNLLDAFKVLDKNSTGADGIDLSALSSFSSTASDDPPKQVAMAMERLSLAACLIADVRLGDDHILEAFLIAVENPHQTSKTIQVRLKEESSMLKHFQDLRQLSNRS